MYFFGSMYGMQRSFEYLQGAWSSSSLNYQLVNLFTGVPPTDFSTIPLEWGTNVNELMKNSVGSIQVAKTNRDVHATPGQITADYTHQRTLVHPKGSYFDATLNRWVIEDFNFTLWRSSGGIAEWETRSTATDRGNLEPQASRVYYEHLEDITFRDNYNFLAMRYHRTRSNQTSISELFATDSNLGRSAQLYPFVMDFRNEQTIDGLHLRQNGSNNSSATIIVDIWDTDTNDWGDQFTLTLFDGYNRQTVDFPQAYTTDRIRLTFSDTGSSSLYLMYCTPVSKVEPTIDKLPKDITWGIITYTGGNQSNASFWNYPRYFYNTMDSSVTHNQTHGYPMMLVDVGEPGDDATVILNKSRGVLPGEEISVLHMGLNWREGNV